MMTQHPARRALIASTLVAVAYGVGSLIVAVIEGTSIDWRVLVLSRGAGAAVAGTFTFFWSYFAFFRPAASAPPDRVDRPLTWRERLVGDGPAASAALRRSDTMASVLGVALGVAGVVVGLLDDFLPILLLGVMFLVLGLGQILLARHRSRRRDASGRAEQERHDDERSGTDLSERR